MYKIFSTLFIFIFAAMLGFSALAASPEPAIVNCDETEQGVGEPNADECGCDAECEADASEEPEESEPETTESM